MSYNIEYISRPFENIVFQPLEDGKTNFYSNNMSLTLCAAMILGDVEARGDFHRLLYGRYLAGFAFEGYDLLPPLCILQIVHDDMAVNAVYHDGMIYDPKLGVISTAEYEKQNIPLLSYVQIYIPEAYENTDWKPYIPAEIQAEFDKNAELAEFFHTLPPMQQSKILNYIYPFSKPSSFKENRTSTKPITQTNTQKIISHIKSFMTVPATETSAWDELKKFETIEAVETLKKCGITEGMTVLDMGCGHGHYTFAASIAANPGGKVIAVDLDKKALNHTETKASEYGLKNIIFLKTSEKGLDEYKESIDFIILYDVLHGLFNYTKSDWGKTTKIEFIESLVPLLKPNGILSLALYDEIEHKKAAVKTKDGKESFKSVPVPHDEAIQPYIELMRSSGLELSCVIENGGVHFDDFHNPSKWRKYGEIKISSLERRNIYNFRKM
ncbi:MAG: methyltransferase domain-containing protein [Oscillospiraceae bacterium]|nr:methyltransferase domain-containing protein [Oscillospiraceae bacterium]